MGRPTPNEGLATELSGQVGAIAMQGSSTHQPRRVLLALEPVLAIPVAQAFAELGFATGLAFTTNQVAALASDVDVLVGDESVDPGGTVLTRLAQDVGAACVFVPSN